jgi:hypothetical protein
MAQPASFFVAIVLFTPQTPLLPQGGITEKTHPLVDSMGLTFLNPAECTLIFVELMFFTEGTSFVLKFRMTQPAAILVTVMLLTPQTSFLSQGRIADKTGFSGFVMLMDARSCIRIEIVFFLGVYEKRKSKQRSHSHNARTPLHSTKGLIPVFHDHSPYSSILSVSC